LPTISCTQNNRKALTNNVVENSNSNNNALNHLQDLCSWTISPHKIVQNSQEAAQSRNTHILHQSVARDARHALVRVSAAQRAAETR
jgi:hypothetical protein